MVVKIGTRLVKLDVISNISRSPGTACDVNTIKKQKIIVNKKIHTLAMRYGLIFLHHQ